MTFLAQSLTEIQKLADSLQAIATAEMIRTIAVVVLVVATLSYFVWDWRQTKRKDESKAGSNDG